MASKDFVGCRRGAARRFQPPLSAWVWRIGVPLFPVAFLVAAGPPRVEKTFPTTLTPLVTIHNLKGRVVVRGWNKAKVHATCELASPRVELDAERLPATDPADSIHLTTHVVDPLATSEDSAANYNVEMPQGARLEISNPEGSVTIQGIRGDASVESVSGAVAVTDAGGQLSVRTMEGDIKIVHASGSVEAYSIDGDLQFLQTASSHLRASTTTGKITYEGDFVPGGEYILSDYSGDTEILCPASASFELRAKTVRGRVENSFPMKPRRAAPSPFAFGRSFFGTSSTGEAMVEATSFTGTIHIRPLP